MSDDSKKKPDTPETPEEHRVRMRFDWDNLIEDLIEEGRQQGVFDNLPGRGKPLKLNQNPYNRANELAHDLLKKNDMRPAWISSRHVLLALIKDLRQEIQAEWSRHERAFRYAQGEAQQGPLRISWDDTCLTWQAHIAELNKQIDDFNLKRPSDNLEVFKVRFEEELARAGAPRFLA